MNFWPFRRSNKAPIVPVIRLSGVIGSSSAFRPGLNMAETAGVIERAFSTKHSAAIAVQVNSPGGSPVQSTLIFKRIRALADEKKLPVYVFAEDVAASGGYLMSLAGDEIYADESSVIGSIGVISAGFGFNQLIEKYGVERRVYTAGKSKSTLDPFLPENPEDVGRLRRIQDEIHGHFIDLVKDRRGDKIADAGDQLFTGEFWSGAQAVELGLIDGLSDLRSKMHEIFGEKVKLKLISGEKGFLRRRLRLPFGGRLSELYTASENQSGLVDDVITTLEARSLWSRYGL